MDQILVYIKDPAWWFSAFFVAIIASVIAGFAKDRIRQWTSVISVRSRERHQKRLAAIEALAKNEGFVIISMIRTAIMIVISVTAFTLLMLSLIWAELLLTLCATSSSDPACGPLAKSLPLVALLIFGPTSIFTGYLSSSLIKTAMSGYRAYRKQRGFPPVD